MRILVIGFGKMGMLHAAILRRLPESDGLAVCEPSDLVHRALGAFKASFPVFRSHREALEKFRPDAAVLAVPPSAQAPLFKDLLSSRVHVFAEKPFMTNLFEAETALAAWQNSPAPAPCVMTGYCLRFAPVFERAGEILRAGAIGKILIFEAKMRSSDVIRPASGWRFQKESHSGGVLFDLGSHLVDLLRHFFGMPASVRATAERRFSKEVDDFVRAEFTYPEFSGTLEACWSVPGVRKSEARLRVEGEAGSLSLDNQEVELTVHRSGGPYPVGIHRWDAVGLETPVPFDLAGPFYTRQLMEFLRSAQTGAPHRNTLEEAVENHRLMDQIKQATQPHAASRR